MWNKNLAYKDTHTHTHTEKSNENNNILDMVAGRVNVHYSFFFSSLKHFGFASLSKQWSIDIIQWKQMLNQTKLNYIHYWCIRMVFCFISPYTEFFQIFLLNFAYNQINRLRKKKERKTIRLSFVVNDILDQSRAFYARRRAQFDTGIQC